LQSTAYINEWNSWNKSLKNVYALVLIVLKIICSPSHAAEHEQFGTIKVTSTDLQPLAVAQTNSSPPGCTAMARGASSPSSPIATLS
jgi:hypothetical protein